MRPSRPFALATVSVAALALAACGGRVSLEPATTDAAAAEVCAGATTFTFVPDTGESAEAYLCFGFDAGAIGD